VDDRWPRRRQLSKVGRLILALMLMLAPLSTGDALVYGVSIIDRFDAADAVVIAWIEKAEVRQIGERPCGVRYTATIFEILKERTPLLSSTVIFGASDGLAENRAYLLFLTKITSPGEGLGKLLAHPAWARDTDGSRGSLPPSREILPHIQCGDLVPGFWFDFDLAWPIMGGRFVIDQPPFITDWPKHLRRERPERGIWWTAERREVINWLRTLSQP
jgi:hypothetical protein